MRFVKLVVVTVAMVMVAAHPAGAQYPGTTSTTLAPTSQNLGTLAIGSETTAVSCGFQPGTATVRLNGGTSIADTVDSDGCARTTVAVLSASQVRVEGTTTAATCANNVLSVTGTATGGGSRTVTTSFAIACPDGGALPRTGAMILRWSLGAGALLAVGALFVLAGRRRNTTTVA